ncbi:MAG: transferase hexapeptide repeat containing protein [Conexibacter sp.]|nr:transferase hexapeptide repeat containing protein [Conexibacter sp.]
MPIENLSDLRGWVRADLNRYDRDPLATLVREPQTRWQVLLRVAEYATNTRGPLAGGILRWLLQGRGIRLGYTIPVNVCGPGLKLPHWGTLVISPAARVGAGCTIHPGTTLGIHAGGAPQVGDGVYIGPGAKAYGPVSIGDGASLGANCVVNQDVRPGAKVAGVPAAEI